MIECVDLGLISYTEAWGIQEELRARRERGDICDRLLLLEHPPVLTLGKRECEEDIVSSPEAIAADGIGIVKANRGGRITYHGPGQLVGYFIFDVADVGVKRFVCLIEELLIQLLSDFGIQSHRDGEHPGVWVGRDKIAAIGLHVSRGITQHGFSLNVDPDLSHYRHIVPCGIRGRGVTSMKMLMGTCPAMDAVRTTLKTKLDGLFIKNRIVPATVEVDHR